MISNDPDVPNVLSREKSVQEETLMVFRPAFKRPRTASGAETTAPYPAVRRPATSRPGHLPPGRKGPAGPVVQLDAQLRERRSAFDSDAARRLVARVRHRPRGPFDAATIVPEPADSLGLLVLDGLIALGLDAGRAQVSWLIGPGDLIRPWDMRETCLTEQPRWHAITNTRVALLDGDFSRRAGGIPVVARSVVARAAQTSQWLLAKSLIVSAPVIEERLLLLFALLAERWGKVRSEGVWLELPLTHDMLARMTGARRPSVSTALRSLDDAGLVESMHRGCWLLHGFPASRERSVGWATNPCWRLYADVVGFAGTTDRADQGVGRDRAA
jgi:CRP/FNR family cyclic AMP-dependent transcriptional regulator